MLLCTAIAAAGDRTLCHHRCEDSGARYHYRRQGTGWRDRPPVAIAMKYLTSSASTTDGIAAAIPNQTRNMPGASKLKYAMNSPASMSQFQAPRLKNNEEMSFH